MPPIKNIIFDLGGVLIDIDYKLTQSAFEQLGYENAEEMYSQLKVNTLFEKLETGKIEEETFYQAMLASAPEKVTKDAITAAWNAMLLHFRTESLAFLHKLRPHYRIFLLSNTNIIHKRAFDEQLRKETSLSNLEECFDKCYYSHLVGMRKPDAEIYQFVLEDGEMTPEETLFIDDTLPNIEGANRCGIQTHWLRQGERVELLFSHLISS